MYYLLIVLTLICAVLLIAVVLVQKSKGGGLSSTFAGSNQIMGVRRTNSFIEKMTWSLAGIIALLAVLSTFFMPRAITSTGSRVIETTTEQTTGADFNTNPVAAPAPAPAPEAPAAPADGE